MLHRQFSRGGGGHLIVKLTLRLLLGIRRSTRYLFISLPFMIFGKGIRLKFDRHQALLEGFLLCMIYLPYPHSSKSTY